MYYLILLDKTYFGNFSIKHDVLKKYQLHKQLKNVQQIPPISVLFAQFKNKSLSTSRPNGLNVPCKPQLNGKTFDLIFKIS